jgi:nitroreductase
MKVFDAIKTRRSIRGYDGRSVEKEKLMKVLEAGRLAPSAKNLQPWSFVIVTDRSVIEKLGKAFNREWFSSSPIVIVACALLDEAWIREDGEEFWKVDVAIAIQNMVLQAWEEGLGTCWIGDFDEREVNGVLGIPKNVRAVSMFSLGYPAKLKDPISNRKPIDEIIRYDRW